MSRPRASCSPRHRRFCSPAHADLVQSYRDARDARDALRESDTAVPAAWSAGGAVSAYQLEAAEFDQAYPAVTFREWLLDHAGRNEEPAW